MQAAKRIGTKGQHLALKVLLLQSCAGVVASGIVAILMSLDSGLDALVGVVANIVPAGIFAFFCIQIRRCIQERLGRAEFSQRNST